MDQTPDSRKKKQKPRDTLEKAMLCAAAASRKKAQDLMLLDVAELTGYADYFLLASGRSTRAALAIAEEVRRVMRKRGVKTRGEEGMKLGTWALLDFGDVVVHVFHQPVREFYDLESLWGDAPRVELDEDQLQELLPPAE
jgi:ribosome-associated protein